MFKRFWSKIDFPASNCAAQIFTYVPMTLLLSLNYLTAGEFRESASEYFEGKLPAYLTFLCLIANLSLHLKRNYQNYPDPADLKHKTAEQKEAVLTILYRMRLNKESTQLFLEQESNLDSPTIKTLLHEELHSKSTIETLKLYEPLEKIYLLKHPQNLSQSQQIQKILSSAFNGLLHGLAHLNIPILLKVFANKDVIRDNEFSPEETICRLILLLGVYSIFQTTIYNLRLKTPTTNDLLTCLNGNFFQQKSKKIPFDSLTESSYLFQTVIVNNSRKEEDCEEIEKIVLKRSKADINMPCCMAGHGIS